MELELILLPCVQVSYSLRRLTALQSQNLYVGPQQDTEFSCSSALGSLFPGLKTEPDPIKGGLRVCHFFTYNCLCVSDVYTHHAITKKRLRPKCTILKGVFLIRLLGFNGLVQRMSAHFLELPSL